MSRPKHFTLCLNAILATLALLLCSGCITISDKTYSNMVRYAPVQSPVQIEASATVEAVDTISPEVRAIWKKWMNNDQTIANYLTALAGAVRNDLTASGLFTRIITDPSARADYHIKAVCLESRPSDFRFTITLIATDTSTGKEVSSRTREHSLGTSMFEVKIQEKLPGIVAQAKADLAADLLAITRQKQEQVERVEAEQFTNANLTDLLVSSDKHVPLARSRNRAIVAAKIQQLPALVHDLKTEELTALVVKIEQTILDLNHECEVAKDQAQQSIANGNTQLEETRGLAIFYRERIELLKPILTALKEEISNRNR